MFTTLREVAVGKRGRSKRLSRSYQQCKCAGGYHLWKECLRGRDFKMAASHRGYFLISETYGIIGQATYEGAVPACRKLLLINKFMDAFFRSCPCFKRNTK